MYGGVGAPDRKHCPAGRLNLEQLCVDHIPVFLARNLVVEEMDIPERFLFQFGRKRAFLRMYETDNLQWRKNALEVFECGPFHIIEGSADGDLLDRISAYFFDDAIEDGSRRRIGDKFETLSGGIVHWSLDRRRGVEMLQQFGVLQHP